jgi:DnaJ-class molecular chaperone
VRRRDLDAYAPPCSHCSGTGEGTRPGRSCYNCRGTGEERVYDEDAEYDRQEWQSADD